MRKISVKNIINWGRIFHSSDFYRTLNIDLLTYSNLVCMMTDISHKKIDYLIMTLKIQQKRLQQAFKDAKND